MKSNSSGSSGGLILLVVVILGLFCCLGTAGLGVVGFMAYTVSERSVESNVVATSPPMVESRPMPAATDGWERRTLKDVSIESPYAMGAGPDVTAQLPAQVQSLLDYLETYQSEGSPDDFIVMVSRFKYKAGTQVSLDGSIQGAMTQSAASMGDANPQYTTNTLKVSGLDARRAHYEGTAQGTPIRLDVVVAQHENQLWQVQVIHMGAKTNSDAERILGSIEITP